MAVSTKVASTSAEVTAGLAALADPLRLEIVGALADGEHCVCDLLERVPVAANLLSYHLRILREAGLLTASRRGRWVDYRLDADGFAGLWTRLASAGVPLPGEPAAAGRAGSCCEEPGGAR